MGLTYADLQIMGSLYVETFLSCFNGWRGSYAVMVSFMCC